MPHCRRRFYRSVITTTTILVIIIIIIILSRIVRVSCSVSIGPLVLLVNICSFAANRSAVVVRGIVAVLCNLALALDLVPLHIPALGVMVG